MNLVRDLALCDPEGHYHVVVEVPRGCQVKLKYDEEQGLFLWSRELVRGVAFPYDFGFFPRTLAADGDPLDALVFSEQSAYPGVVVPTRIIGALRVEQKRGASPKKRNDRVIVVPANGHRSDGYVDVREIPKRILSELEVFFKSSLALTGKQLTFRGWAGADEARDLVDEAAQGYRVKRVGKRVKSAASPTSRSARGSASSRPRPRPSGSRRGTPRGSAR